MAATAIINGNRINPSLLPLPIIFCPELNFFDPRLRSIRSLRTDGKNQPVRPEPEKYKPEVQPVIRPAIRLEC
jgi:hypothetical protein